MTSLLVLYVGSGILAVLISLPLMFEKIGPNPFYGFRVSSTLNDPASWYAVNKYFARHLLVVGLVQILAAVALALIPGISVDGYALAVLAVFVLVFSVAMFRAWRYLKSRTSLDKSQ